MAGIIKLKGDSVGRIAVVELFCTEFNNGNLLLLLVSDCYRSVRFRWNI